MEDGDHFKDEERDIQSKLRQAEKSAPNSSVRRAVLENLIELAHHPNAHLKIIAAQHIKDFLKEFTDIEEDAINAVYDICEDAIGAVRIEGYKAITSLSLADAKWVKRNTDVLLQLLQSEEEDEIQVIQQALIDHLEISPAITLGVLYDQLLPADDSVDESERDIRVKLASIVHSFLTNAARTAIDGRPTRNADYADAFIATLPHLTDEDFDKAVREHLLPLSMFKSPSKHSDDLLRVIIQRIEACLRTDLNRSPPTLESSRRHLKLASYLVVEKRLANPHPLLLLYIPFTSRPKLSRLPKSEQTSLLRDLTGILAAAEDTYSATHHEPLLQQINIALNATPIIVEGLSSSSAQPATIEAYENLLKVCKQRKDQGWTLPPHVSKAVQSLPSSVQQLVKVLVSPQQTGADTSRRGMNRQTSRQTSDNPSQSRSSVAPRRVMQIPQSKIPDGPAGTSSQTPKKRSPHSAEPARQAKRAKLAEGDANEGISLLERLQIKPKSGNQLHPQSLRAPQRVQHEESVVVDHPPQPPQLSIKGAASGQGTGKPTNVPLRPPQPASLLDRLGSTGPQTHRGRR